MLFRILKISTLLVMGMAYVIPAQAAIQDDLVAYWPFEGNFDDIINGYHGESSETADDTPTPPIPFVSGKFGDSVLLDGEDQTIYINGGSGGNDNTIVSPNAADGGETIENRFDFTFDAEDPTTGSMSVSAWFTANAFDTNWQALVAKGEGQGWRVHRRGGDNPPELAFTGGNGDTIKNNVEVTLNDGDDLVWHHVVALTDATFIHEGTEGAQAELGDFDAMMLNSTRLYLDGELIASKINGQLDGPVGTDRANLMQIGGNPDSEGREWEGHIDDVAVWERALTNDEIASLYNDGAGNSVGFLLNPGLVGDFNGDDKVDFADFTILSANFNGPGGLEQGDTNFNKRVDLTDFLVFRDAFLNQGAAGAAPVPEPTGLALLGMGTAIFALRRRRRR